MKLPTFFVFLQSYSLTLYLVLNIFSSFSFLRNPDHQYHHNKGQEHVFRTISVLNLEGPRGQVHMWTRATIPSSCTFVPTQKYNMIYYLTR